MAATTRRDVSERSWGKVLAAALLRQDIVHVGAVTGVRCEAGVRRLRYHRAEQSARLQRLNYHRHETSAAAAVGHQAIAKQAFTAWPYECWLYVCTVAGCSRGGWS